MMRKISLVALAVAGAVASHASGPVTLFAPRTAFAGDGWLSPGTEAGGYIANPADNNVRGMAIDQTRGRVLVPSRTNVGGTGIRYYDLNGVYQGVYNMAGVTGGTFAFSHVAVDQGTGDTYAANLVTNSAGTSLYKIYKWSDPTLAPTLVYSGQASDPSTGASNGFRVGDSFSLSGTGANLRITAGYNQSSNAAVTGERGFALFTPNGSGGLNFTNVNNFSPTADEELIRYDQSLAGPGSIYGNGKFGYVYLTFDPMTGNALSRTNVSGLAGGAAERGCEYIEINGYKLLATVDVGSAAGVNDGIGVARIYDASNPTSLVSLGSARAIPLGTSMLANGNGSVKMGWGKVTPAAQGYDAVLYAMIGNNGIQAFNVHVVPEPGTYLALGLGIAGLVLRRRAKK